MNISIISPSRRMSEVKDSSFLDHPSMNSRLLNISKEDKLSIMRALEHCDRADLIPTAFEDNKDRWFVQYNQFLDSGTAVRIAACYGSAWDLKDSISRATEVANESCSRMGTFDIFGYGPITPTPIHPWVSLEIDFLQAKDPTNEAVILTLAAGKIALTCIWKRFIKPGYGLGGNPWR